MAIGYERAKRLRNQRPGSVLDTRDIRRMIDEIDNLPEREYQARSVERTALVSWLNSILNQ